MSEDGGDAVTVTIPLTSLKEMRAERDCAQSTNVLLRATNVDLNRKLMDSRMEAMALRDQLARFMEAKAPKPVVLIRCNPFREFAGDRRRVGG